MATNRLNRINEDIQRELSVLIPRVKDPHILLQNHGMFVQNHGILLEDHGKIMSNDHNPHQLQTAVKIL